MRVGRKLAGFARIHRSLNYVTHISVQRNFRGLGLSWKLMEFIVADRKRKLNRTPASMKNKVTMGFAKRRPDLYEAA